MSEPMIQNGKMIIIHRAIRLLHSLLKWIPLKTLIARSIATQAFSQESKYTKSLRRGSIDLHPPSTTERLIDKLIWVRITNQNLTVNILMVRREVIDDAKR